MFQEQIQKLAGINGVTLPESQSLSDEAYVQWQADTRNRIKGKMTGYDCPECLNRGVIFSVKGCEVVGRDCKCMETRRSAGRMRRSGLSQLIEDYTFEKFKTPDNWQRQLKDKAMAFVENPCGWFGALGQVGAGKTHICTAICVEFLKSGLETRYMMWRDDSVRLKGCVNEPKEYDKYIMPLKTADVLYIDDLFKTEKGKSVSQADINLAFELLNYRYINRDLITVISSERTVMDILDIDEAVGSRIYERVKDNCMIISGKEKNWRLR